MPLFQAIHHFFALFCVMCEFQKIAIAFVKVNVYPKVYETAFF